MIFFTFYKSEIYWNGNKRDYYLNIYLINILIIFFSIITFYVSEKFKTYLIIFFFSTIFSLYTFELYLIKEPVINKSTSNLEKKIKIYKELSGKKYDLRKKIEVYKDLKKKNKNVAVDILWTSIIQKQNNQPSNSSILGKEIFPLSSISNSKIIHCNENGYFSSFESDRYGFNNLDEVWDEAEIEYLMVGDSFVHGACVNRPHDISSVLRILSKKTVVNLGQSETGPLIMYSRLREYIKPNVKNIVWFFYEGNDYDDLRGELQSKILSKYLYDLNFSQNLKSKQSLINELVRKEIVKEEQKIDVIINKKKKNLSNYFFEFIKLFNTRYLLFYGAKLNHPGSEYKDILKLTKELAKKNNSNLYFVYLPAWDRYRNNFDISSRYNKFYKEILKFTEELNISFIDMHKEVFLKESDPLKLFPFKEFGHYNEEGYKKVSKKIYSIISKD